jgi:hypothetical protein
MGLENPDRASMHLEKNETRKSPANQGNRRLTRTRNSLGAGLWPRGFGATRGRYRRDPPLGHDQGEEKERRMEGVPDSEPSGEKKKLPGRTPRKPFLKETSVFSLRTVSMVIDMKDRSPLETAIRAVSCSPDTKVHRAKSLNGADPMDS